jgi:NAD(P)-dependent dehydrogenase (short-subunit alcohol dehydrogenase family)
MAGQVCLVTGATSGIGKFVARELACQGAEVILAGRNQQKLDETISWIRSETGHDVFDYLLADFSDLQQVRDLARRYQDRHQKLDVLINNAGSFFNTRRNTSYGVELTFLGPIFCLRPFARASRPGSLMYLPMPTSMARSTSRIWLSGVAMLA